jgi:paraquat-inducible protein B
MPHHINKKYNTPKVKTSRTIQILTTVWIVPFIAMIIALWLAYQYYSKIGPTIHISFKANAGLVANQSQLKLRDVTVGKVSKISLSEDGTGVTVELKVDKAIAPYLNEKSKFWIVHADVGSHGVSGLDTLLSGSYIELYGLKEEETKHEFTGLERPFIDKDAEGKYYLLSAPESFNISEGSNVYYRMIKVGSVERVAITPDGKKINFTIFVKEQYTSFINEKSQFYTRSSLSIDVSHGKLDMNIASVSQLVHGGISIYTPVHSIGEIRPKSHKQKRVFPLYKSLAQMKEKHLSNGINDKVYVFKFEDKENKLEIGSPVEFNGYQVGYITEIESHFDKNTSKIETVVFALIHTKAFSNNDNKEVCIEALEKMVNNGLSATLDSSLPLIGSDYINLVFDHKSAKQIRKLGAYDLFPTIKKKKSSNLLNDTQRLIQKLERLPLEDVLKSATALLHDNNKPLQNVLKDLRKTINSFNKIISNLDTTVDNLNKFTGQKSLQKLPEELTLTLNELTLTLERVQELSQEYGADSKFASELSIALRELSLTAESMGRVSLKLEKKPNALILGDD